MGWASLRTSFLGANPLPDGGHGVPTFGTEAYGVNVAGHAAVGCLSSVAEGGKCGSGALAAALSAGAAPAMVGMSGAQKLVASAVLGGVGSVAGGGKFANGAVTGAFGYLFNQAAMAMCIGGPAPCVVGAGITTGQFLFGASVAVGAAAVGGAIVYNSDGQPKSDPNTPAAPAKPEGIPDDWVEKPSDKNGGTEWVNPENPNDRVRVMPGNPASPYPWQQGPYVVDQKGGFRDVDGNMIPGANPGKSPEAHIPYDDFKFRR